MELSGRGGGKHRPPVNPVENTRVVEFNDLNALEDDAEAIAMWRWWLAEPAMTNVELFCRMRATGKRRAN